MRDQLRDTHSLSLTHTHIHTQLHTETHTHTRRHTNTHTHTHTHTHSLTQTQTHTHGDIPTDEGLKHRDVSFKIVFVKSSHKRSSVLQCFVLCVAVCCSVLQCVALTDEEILGLKHRDMSLRHVFVKSSRITAKEFYHRCIRAL